MPLITVFTRDKCQPCLTAKAMLTERGLKFREVDVMSGEEARAEFLHRTAGAKTVPQILVDEQQIGGSTDLAAIIDTPQFQQLIGGS